MLVDRLALAGVAGTNKVMAGEMSRLAGRALKGFRLPEPRKVGLGGLTWPFRADLAAVAVGYHRTASRVLWDLYESRATRLEPLYDELCDDVRRETRPWLRDGATFSVSPGATRTFAAGGRQMVGVVKNALIDGAAARGLRLAVDPERPDVFLTVNAHEDVVTVSIDLAGQSMNMRGYRTEGGGAAPLRENLAAVLVMLARHDGRSEVLVDPMAGSGTIAIEAACMAQGRPVWIPPRAPAATHLPPVDEALRAPAEPLFGDTRPLVFANELDRATYARARQNVERAGVADLVRTTCGDFRDLSPRMVLDAARARGMDPERGLILCNPPYGERLDPPALRTLYRDLGAWCRQFRGWRAGILVANPDFIPAFGGRPRVEKPLNNGPNRGWFYLYDD
jgi:23S rRNA G2445 N2-methylase RlmL